MSLSTISDSKLTAATSRRRPRHMRGAGSVIAYGEPMLWLTGGGLVMSVMMILVLLGYILWQGILTFWPLPLVQVKTIDDRQILGELTQSESFDLNHGYADSLSGPVKEAALRLLNPRLAAACAAVIRTGSLSNQLSQRQPEIARTILNDLENASLMRNAAAADRERVFGPLRDEILSPRSYDLKLIAQRLTERVAADATGARLYEAWEESRQAKDAWLNSADIATAADLFRRESELRRHVWLQAWFARFATDVIVTAKRFLLRTGNYELSNEHFTWVSDFEMASEGRSHPPEALVMERLKWGRFYGVPKAFSLEGQTIASTPDGAWDEFLKHWPQARERWEQARGLEEQIGDISRDQNAMRLELRQIELAAGKDSHAWQEADRAMESRRRELTAKSDALRARITELDQTNDGYRLIMETAQGQEQPIVLAEVVRAYHANQLGWGSKLGIYGSRWSEFLLDRPREANSEGGVLPAIFGTVAMTLMMTLIVVPFGVLAALYLKEYARGGFAVRLVRIAVNNLAGVPSIVFGVFGLGFFCYLMGARIDQLFFQANLPSPTFATGGLIWSALTLALLTLPVVIVATEEALAAVPNSLREGSYACGASKWQTIRRIVLPHALPGIMTGMILAMARGAGEVAPLMLVGAVKVADDLPVDAIFPFVHLERSFMHLGFHIYDLGVQSPNADAAKPMVFTTTLLLIVVIATLNIAAITVRARLRQRYRAGHF